MSVSHVRNPTLPVVVADDLESFLHVLVYYGVRYLRHTLQDATTPFVIDYFDTFQVGRGGKILCSSQKVYAVDHGVIRVDEGVLKFKASKEAPDHPLDRLFKRWLRLFVARYRLPDQVDDKPRETNVPTEETTPTELEAMLASQADPESDSDSEDSDAEDAATVSKWKRRAKALETHKKTESILRRALKASGWPKDDVVGDQLTKGYNPKRYFVAQKTAMASSSVHASGHVSSAKKAKLEASAAAAARSGPTASDAPLVPSLQKRPTRRKFHKRRATRPRS